MGDFIIVPPEQARVLFGYAASSNISFHGTLDSGYTRQEWDGLSEKAKEEVFTEAVWDLVDMWEIDDE